LGIVLRFIAGASGLVGGGSADDEMGIIGRGVAGDVGGQQGLFMRAGGLAFIQRDQHRDGGIEGVGDAGQDVFQEIVNVIAADIEEMKLLAGIGSKDFFFGELLEFQQAEGLQALTGAERIAGTFFDCFCHRMVLGNDTQNNSFGRSCRG
jgi:hypothetical protein